MVNEVKHGIRAVWKTPPDSNGNGGNNCVEVALLNTAVAVGDSKDPNGPALIFGPKAWDSFVNGVKDNEFDL